MYTGYFGNQCLSFDLSLLSRHFWTGEVQTKAETKEQTIISQGSTGKHLFLKLLGYVICLKKCVTRKAFLQYPYNFVLLPGCISALKPLGLASEKVPNAQITASSLFNSYHQAWQARLNHDWVWCASSSQKGTDQYVQVCDSKCSSYRQWLSMINGLVKPIQLAKISHSLLHVRYIEAVSL